MSKLFAKETDLVAAFSDCLSRGRWLSSKPIGEGWTEYHETAGWDLLLVHETGMQVGIEAKLSLNPKVLAQALPGHYDTAGPDYRAVLVPADACQNHMVEIAGHLGVTVITVRQKVVDGRYIGWDGDKVLYSDETYVWSSDTELPTQQSSYQDQRWHPWLPEKRCPLPDYVPDVVGGDAAPVALTPWKIKAIKLLVLLDRRGTVHRSDMKAIGISPTRWTDRYYGYLDPTPSGYIRNSRTPDLKAQHPRNWTEIEADFDSWSPYAQFQAA